MDLNKLYNLQAELDKHILEKHNIKMSKEELLDNTILALLVEAGELANTTRCFKHWSTKGMMDKEVILDELADVWHFYLSIGNQLGLEYDNYEYRGSYDLKWVFKIIYREISNLCEESHLQAERYYVSGYSISLFTELLGFTDEEVEQAYLKKHEENYKRQREGY